MALIRAAIGQAGGAISFAEYMDLALFAPELGYYHGGARLPDGRAYQGVRLVVHGVSPMGRHGHGEIVDRVDGQML